MVQRETKFRYEDLPEHVAWLVMDFAGYSQKVWQQTLNPVLNELKSLHLPSLEWVWTPQGIRGAFRNYTRWKTVSWNTPIVERLDMTFYADPHRKGGYRFHHSIFMVMDEPLLKWYAYKSLSTRLNWLFLKRRHKLDTIYGEEVIGTVKVLEDLYK